VYSALIVTLTSPSGSGAAAIGSVTSFLPGVLYDTIVAMFLGPIAVTLHDRRAVTERADW
jgi:hypothetical protein